MTDQSPCRDRHQFAFAKRAPWFVSKRDTGEQDHLLEAGRDSHTAGMDGLVGIHAMAGPEPKTRRSDLAVGLNAAVAMGEQHLAIGVKKIGRSEFAQVGSELRNDGPPLRERRWRGGRVPQAVKALEQRAQKTCSESVVPTGR